MKDFRPARQKNNQKKPVSKIASNYKHKSSADRKKAKNQSAKVISSNYKRSRSNRARTKSNFTNKSSAHKTNKLINTLILLLSVFIGLWFFIFLMGIFASFVFPLDRSKLVFITSVEKSGEIPNYIVSFDADQKRLTHVKINADARKSVMGGYGEYKLGSIYALLNLEKADQSKIKSTLSVALEVIIDEVELIENQTNLDSKKDLEHFYLIKALDNFWNFPRFYSLFSNYVFVKSSNYQFLESDGDGFSSRELRAMQKSTSQVCPIAIINTTSTQGLAGKISQVLVNDGMNIIRVDSDSSINQEKSSILSNQSDEVCKLSLERVGQLLPSADIYTDTEKLNQYRAGIIIMLGSDLDL